MRTRRVGLAFALGLGLAGSLAASLPRATAAADAEPTPLDTTLLRLVERVGPGVVRVEVSGERRLDVGPGSDEEFPELPEFFRLLRRLFENPRKGRDADGDDIESGSGTIIDAEGTVLTHAALVAFHEPRIRIHLPDGRQRDGRVLGRDRELDVAMIAIEARAADRFDPVPFGPSEELTPGRFVAAFGNPFGLGRDSTPSVSLGVVTAIRRIEAHDAVYRRRAIQFDAAVNPGNHGGPIVDRRGRLVGVIAPLVQSPRTNAMIGYAIPAHVIHERLDDLREPSDPASLGVLIRPDAGGPDGVAIERVVPDGPAERAGLIDGDVIVSLGGAPLVSYDELVAVMEKRVAGERVTVVIRRDGATRAVEILLGIRREKR